MFGNNPHLTPLVLRKRLLIAESELNRTHLSREWRTLGQGACDFSRRFTTLGAWVSSLALVVTGIAAWHRRPIPAPAARFPWLRKFLHGASVASTFWLASRGTADRISERQSPFNESLASGVGIAGRHASERSGRP